MIEMGAANESETPVRQRRAKGVHRAHGSRSAAMALSATAAAGMMIAMASAEPAWAPATEAYVPEPASPVVVSATTSIAPVPVVAPDVGASPTTTLTISQATPQAQPEPIQLEPVAAPGQTITRTVVVKGGGSGSTVVKSNGSR